MTRDDLCSICEGSGWVAWVEDLRGDKPSLHAVPTTGPPNGCARPCPKCRPREAERAERALP